jgi:hypothetical protein
MKENSFKDTMETDDVVYSWEDLLNHDDPRVSKFARHLQLYLFYTTGFNNRVYGFNNLIPPSMMKSVKVGERTLSIDYAIKELNKKLTDPQYLSFLVDVMDDVMAHSHMFRGVGWNQKMFTINLGDKKAYHLSEKTYPYVFVGYSNSSNPIYTPYIKKGDKTYKYRGYIKISETEGVLPMPIYTQVDNKGAYKDSRYLFEYGLDKTSIDSNITNNKIEKFYLIHIQINI